MIARLGDFLRLTLDHSGQQLVTLKEETEFLRCYLEIEQVRFGDRLTVEFQIEPVALAGYREVIVRDADGAIERHFVILSFAARWLAGEPRLNAELAEARWLRPSELTGLPTTEGLADIVAAAFDRLEQAG